MGMATLLGLLKSSSSLHFPASVGDRLKEPGSTSPIQGKCYSLQFVTTGTGFQRFFSSLTKSNALAPNLRGILPEHGVDKGNDDESQIELEKESDLFVYNSPYSADLNSRPKSIIRDGIISLILFPFPPNPKKLTRFGKCCLALSVVGLGRTVYNYVKFRVQLGHHVQQLRWQLGSDQFEVDKVSWCGMSTTRTVKLSDIRLPPQTGYYYPELTFVANDEPFCVPDVRFNVLLMSRKTILITLLLIYRKMSLLKLLLKHREMSLTVREQDVLSEVMRKRYIDPALL